MKLPAPPRHVLLVSCLGLLAAALLARCGDPEPEPAPDAAVDTAADAALATDTPTDVTATPPGPPTPAARGFEWRRTIVHIHSAYSHDACDGEIDETGKANPTCLGQLRQALCGSGLDVGFLTDHPSHMKSYAFKDLLLHDAQAGDQFVGPAGEPHANVVQCPATAELPAHELVVTVGYEGTHTMPVGLQRHYTATEFQGQTISDEAPFAQARAAVDHAHAVGGVVVNAHSEEDDISVARLVEVGVDAMEIYNFHANFKTVVGQGGSGSKGALGRLFLLEEFLGPKDKSPHPDLVQMLMLDVQPEQAFTKWQQTLAFRHVTGLVGSDVHQNVVLEQFCAPGESLEGLCDALVDQYPNLVNLLKNGGQVLLADGKRIDDYQRVLRWLSDRVLLPAGTPATDRAEATKQALVAGRAWAVFDILGEPQDFDFAAASGEKWVEMGGTVPAGATLWLRVPTAATPAPWAAWTAADTRKPGDATTLRTILWRVAPGAEKAEIVQQVEGFGGTLQHTATLPGRYHAEVRIVPRHLRGLLRGLGDLADKEQRWAVSNAIQVQ